MRRDKSHNLSWMRLTKSYNSIMLKTDLGTGLDIRLVFKLTKFLIETSNKVHETKTYDKTIDNLIYGNKLRKVIDKKLWNLLDSNQA